MLKIPPPKSNLLSHESPIITAAAMIVTELANTTANAGELLTAFSVAESANPAAIRKAAATVLGNLAVTTATATELLTAFGKRWARNRPRTKNGTPERTGGR